MKPRGVLLGALGMMLALLIGGAAAKCVVGRGGCSKCRAGRCVACKAASYEEGNPGYYTAWGLSSAGTCTRCKVFGCLECDGNKPTVCKRCAPYGGETSSSVHQSGLYLTQDGKCGECSYQCDACKGSADQCLSCKDGYAMTDRAKGTCSACKDSNCSKCKRAVGLCDSCWYGHGLNLTERYPTCIKCADSDCISCAKDASQCTECPYGFQLRNGRCRRCRASGCSSCNADRDICDKCASGSGLDLKAPGRPCVACKVEGCSSCLKDARVCEQCESNGYYLQKGKCVKCPKPLSSCGTCSVGPKGRCLSCSSFGESGFNLADPLRPCLACADSGCLDCEQDYTKCVRCVDGFEMNMTTGKCDCILCDRKRA